MKVLVIGGTRFFGIHTINALLENGHEVSIANRGLTKDNFGDKAQRIVFDRMDKQSIEKAFSGKHFDVVIDKLAYCSNDIKNVLEVLDCDRYITMSSTSVYNKHINTVEDDFNPLEKELVWCDRWPLPYDEIKRQAECALCQAYPKIKSVRVRYPFTIGRDDYTNRLKFYIEHTINGTPMYIDNIDSQMGFINSSEAGEFMAYLVDTDFTGAVNGCSQGTISIRQILDYVTAKTGKKPILTDDGEPAPYNCEPEYTINTDIAKSIGYTFSNLNDWIYELLDYYISTALTKN